MRRLLLEERATALTSYDANGIYGHIDHVQVHEIAARSAVGTDCELYEATLSRDDLRRIRRELLGRGLVAELWSSAQTEQLGVEDGPDVVRVDVAHHLPTKLAAVAAHSSQVLEASSFMGLPAGVFHHLFRAEWFRVARRGGGRFLDLVEASGTAPGVGSAWEFAALDDPPGAGGTVRRESGRAGHRRSVADDRLDPSHLAA